MRICVQIVSLLVALIIVQTSGDTKFARRGRVSIRILKRDGHSGKLLKTDKQPIMTQYRNGEVDNSKLKGQTKKIPKRNEQPLWILKANGKLNNLNAPLFRIFKRS